MTCPLFIDLTRECIKRFENITQIYNFDICQSDEYNDCFFYHIIKNEFNCKYMNQCIESFLEGTPKFFKIIVSDNKISNIIRPVLDRYCLSESNCLTCKRFNKYENCEDPSYKLFPDGKTHYLDIILGRELTIE
jgi:hypothetical protein